MNDRSPWHRGRFKRKSPASLRLAMLQVSYMGPAQLRELRMTQSQTWWKTCAEWRLSHPAEFRELCELLAIPVTPDGRFTDVPVCSINEAAKATGVSRRTVYNWLREGKVHAVTIPGGQTRIVTDCLRQPKDAKTSAA